MPDPEIDRRCSICGASVRPRALFCPQCGQPIANQAKVSESTQAEPERVSENNPTVELGREAVPDLSETQPLSAAPDLSETQPLSAIPDLAKTQPLKAATAATPEQPPTPKHPKLQRASNAARGLEENVLGRVEKFRKVSSIVIDQAAYDPSLRFILVAAFLFLLFLFLLILSKVIG